MKRLLYSTCLICCLGSANVVQARGLSEASAVSVLVTGSVVAAASALPLIAMQSILDATVASVKPAGNGMTDVEVRQRSTQKACTVRVPAAAVDDKAVKPGQNAELVADRNGHFLRVEGQPVAFIPDKDSHQLIYSKPVK